ncbi:MAG: hypothetical protein NT027_19225 [Proteobacteria bacterium]|nr:hypothetical protein [Pseudomonadota bacterium]
MAIHFFQTSQFVEIRSNIEQHLFDSVLDIEKSSEIALQSIESFANAMDRLMEKLEQMYQTTSQKNIHGEKSFPIRGGGRYRVFFKVIPRRDGDFDITFLDIDDNKQSNLDRFPDHKIITFESDD